MNLSARIARAREDAVTLLQKIHCGIADSLVRKQAVSTLVRTENAISEKEVFEVIAHAREAESKLSQ